LASTRFSLLLLLLSQLNQRKMEVGPRTVVAAGTLSLRL
jgi:hypothetical protein